MRNKSANIFLFSLQLNVSPSQATYVLQNYVAYDIGLVLDFLNLNTKVAAAVLNPLEDDLLLYRMQLQNLIQVQAEQL